MYTWWTCVDVFTYSYPNMLTNPALRWRHNGRDSVLNHQPQPFIQTQINENIKALCHCAGNSPATGEFPAQMASNAENVSIWWRHHGLINQKSWLRIVELLLRTEWSVWKEKIAVVVMNYSNNGDLKMYQLMLPNAKLMNTFIILFLKLKIIYRCVSFALWA